MASGGREGAQSVDPTKGTQRVLIPSQQGTIPSPASRRRLSPSSRARPLRAQRAAVRRTACGVGQARGRAGCGSKHEGLGGDGMRCSHGKARRGVPRAECCCRCGRARGILHASAPDALRSDRSPHDSSGGAGRSSSAAIRMAVAHLPPFSKAAGGMGTTAQHQRAPPGTTDSDDGLSTLCSFHISLWWGSPVQVCAGPSKSDPSTCSLAAHLLQQMVDARASEHVEETASTPSIDM